MGVNPFVRSGQSYGIQADGITDDHVALDAAFKDFFAVAQNLPSGIPCTLNLPAGVCLNSAPLTYVIANPITRPCTINAWGTMIRSTMAAGLNANGNGLTIDASSISGNGLLQGLEINGLALLGNSPNFGTNDNVGLTIKSLTTTGNVLDLVLNHVYLSDWGSDGAQILGNVFESQMKDCIAQNCGGNGVTVGNAGSGIFSAWSMSGGSYRNNKGQGIGTTGFPQDVNLSDKLYCSGNHKEGAYLSLGGTAYQCGFEHNCADSGSSGLAIDGPRAGAFGCTFTNTGGQTNGMQSFITQNGMATMMDCEVGEVGVTSVFTLSNGSSTPIQIRLACKKVFMGNIVWGTSRPWERTIW